MTSTVRVTAHCASTKEVHVLLNGKFEQVLQSGESQEFNVYDDRVISVGEAVRPVSNKYLPHQRRVVDEKIALDEKIGALGNFTLTATFLGLPPSEQKRLQDQLAAMGLYSGILGERIAAFNTGA